MVGACEELPRQSDSTVQQRCGGLMQKAIQAALQFEGEIHFINRISDRQNQLSGLAGATLPRQIALDWAGALHEIEHARVGVALTQLVHLAAKHEEFSQQAIQALKQEASPAHFAPNTDPLSFQEKQWVIMSKAVTERVNRANLQAIAEETEHFLETGEIVKLAFTEDDVAKVKSKTAPPPGQRPTLKLDAAPPVTTSIAPSPLPAPATKEAIPLRLRARQPKESASPARKPSLHELEAIHHDLEQARALLIEEKIQLQARAQFLAESEALLRANLLDHQEREARLAQRAEDLRALKETASSSAPGADQPCWS